MVFVPLTVELYRKVKKDPLYVKVLLYVTPFLALIHKHTITIEHSTDNVITLILGTSDGPCAFLFTQ